MSSSAGVALLPTLSATSRAGNCRGADATISVGGPNSWDGVPSICGAVELARERRTGGGK